MRPSVPHTAVAVALLLAGVAWIHVVPSAPLPGGWRVAALKPAGLASRLERELGLPVEIARVGLDPLAPGLALGDVRVRLGSWRLEVPRLVLRPEFRALFHGDFVLLASARGFTLRAQAGDGAEAAARLDELLEVVGLPDARVRLAGGVVETARGSRLLTDLRFDLRPSSKGAEISVGARQRGAGRFDLHGAVSRDRTLQLDAYLDGLSTPDAERWTRLLADPRTAGLALPRLQVTVSGRWHARIGSRGEGAYEFALQLRATEGLHEGGRPPQTVLRVAGGASVAAARGSGSPASVRIVPGAHVRIRGHAERLRAWRIDAAPGSPPLVLSGPFEIDLLPFGPAREPFFVAEADFSAAHLTFSDGLRKRAGARARLGVSRDPEPGEAAPARFWLEIGPLAARGEIGRDGLLAAHSEWVWLPALADLAPGVASFANGGRARLTSLRASSLDRFEARVEVDRARLVGVKLPMVLGSLTGAARLTRDSLDAHNLVATIQDVPVQLDVHAQRVRSGGEAGLRVRLRAEAGRVEVARSGPLGSPEATPSRRAVGLPPVLARLAEEALQGVRDLEFTRKLEIEEGVFHCRELTVSGDALRDLEIAFAMRSLRVELPRVAFQRGGRRHLYSGLIDLNPLLPDVRIAAVE